ncbi:hypothetical protein E2C01_053797 [Portunus trituberculatus]|uniref:Uncharacterized protein n=1 Tax=Portunus trituberculatus TaxID=210409 RepID=A0A5B7GQ61_PORTR|nr:hypothetical protein [Portunus trituberculatus]
MRRRAQLRCHSSKENDTRDLLITVRPLSQPIYSPISLIPRRFTHPAGRAEEHVHTRMARRAGSET